MFGQIDLQLQLAVVSSLNGTKVWKVVLCQHISKKSSLVPFDSECLLNPPTQHKHTPTPTHTTESGLPGWHPRVWYRCDAVCSVRVHSPGQEHQPGCEPCSRVQALLQQDMECHEILHQGTWGGVHSQPHG